MLETVLKLSYQLNQEEIENLNYFLNRKPIEIKKAFKFEEKYYQYVKRYLQSIQKSKYLIQDIYKQRKYTTNSDRIYGEGSTLQSLSSEITSMIFGDTSFDIDMVNASFHFVKHIAKTFLDKPSYPLINDYCINRNDYLDDEHNKQFFISALFHYDTKVMIKPTNTKKQNDLLKEIQSFKILIMEYLDQFSFVQFQEGSHLGQKVVKIIHHLEAKLLNEIVPDFSSKTKALKHDGFIVDNSVDIEEALKFCNEKGKKYGIKFISKAFDELPSFQDTPPDYEAQAENELANDPDYQMYLKMKENFEKDNFMVLKPLMYYNEKYGKPEEYNKRDFVDLCKPYQFKKKDFFQQWLKDSERRCYRKMIWKPTLDNEEGVYNHFKGFKADYISPENYDDEKEVEYVQPFLEHIQHLCGDDEKALSYVGQYIAHLLQKPEERPDSFIIMISEEGTGKDLLIDFIVKMIGKELVYRESNMDNITGNFNEGLEGKLLLQMNEVNGKHGHSNADAIKDLITRDYHNINKKYGAKYQEKNYLRGFAFFNGLNGMKVEAGSRRFMVCKCNDPKSKEYYEKLVELKNNEEAINYIYTYFCRMDISKFVPSKNIPKTNYHNGLAEVNTNPFYPFLHDVLKYPDDYDVKSKKEFSFIGQQELYKFYENYIEKNKLNISVVKKQIKLMLVREGFKEAKLNFKNKPQVRAFKYNHIALKEKYDNKYGKEEDIEEIDFSDDEEPDFLE